MAGHIGMPYSVVSRPQSRPEVPIMTPELRSNSPAIISRATGTATMPTVEATSVQRAVPLMVANDAGGVDGGEHGVDDDGAHQGSELGSSEQARDAR